MGKIRQLSPSVVNKIAAGEVVERPASVVKELMENALDAGATRVDVSVVKGGTELIRIVDNGHGIEPDDLPLAVASHATSKIADADDLFRIGTLGFRGEALASIAEVSRLTIRSRTSDTAAGAQLEVQGGAGRGVEPCGCPIGTTMEVADLFFNTPVRRKFLRSTQTEMGHIAEAVTRVALAHPHVHFTLRHNEREVHDLPPASPWSSRIERLFGGELAGQLIWVESQDEAIRLHGYAAHPSESRSNQKMQYLFLNGRFIRDRSLQHALGEAYRGLMMTGRYPVSFLRIELPPELVDVNVHPTKLEVRFQDGGRLYSQLLSTLRTKFLTTDLTTNIHAAPTARYDAAHHAPAGGGAERLAHAQQARQEMVSWAKEQMTAWKPGPDARPAGQVIDPWNLPAERGPLELTRLDRAWPAGGADSAESDFAQRAARGEASPLESFPAPQRAALGSEAARAMTAGAAEVRATGALQIHNRYLVAESDEGVVVIDQHALHERILYEQLCDKVEAGQLESQTLLVPEPVDLTTAEAAVVLEERATLARLGIQVEPFGGGTVLVSSYPAMLANIRPGEILRGIVEQLSGGNRAPDRRDLLNHLLHSIACKAAVKAGDRLTPDEISALLAQRGAVRNTHHCPHGRPTELVFTREELDKQFKRT